MGWIQQLHETYELCAGHEPQGSALLMAIGHTPQQAHIEIVINGDGQFRRGSVLPKGTTVIIPATEDSATRSSGEAPHPLCDKIQYCAGDYQSHGGEKTPYFTAFQQLLERWCNSKFSHPKAKAVFAYVSNGRVVSDLLAHDILHARSGRLLTDWVGDDPEPEIFRLLTPKNDGGRKVRDQGDALIRWRIEAPGEVRTGTWEDPELAEAWQRFYASEQKTIGFCMVTGNTESALARKHPAKMRNGADKAKLISSNDKDGYTYRGRFFEANEACCISFEASQKSHNALQWLISRQGYKASGQVFIAWCTGGNPVPDPFKDSLELFLDSEEIQMSGNAISREVGDAGQTFSLRLKRAINGYASQLAPSDDIVVMGLDSATPGRMAITFYREIKASEFLRRIETWHTKCSWPQNFGKDKHFIGAPAPRDIAEAAFGRRLDDKLRKATVERLLPCIVDGQPIPRDLVVSTVRQASNRPGLENWAWEKCLGIACALFRGHHTEREYKMGLEQERHSRDYLYGRLLAVADHLEGRALLIAEEKRDTTASRLMQRFADHPLSTWRTIELSLSPYKSRLRSNSTQGGFLWTMEKLLDEVMAAFNLGDFINDSSLSGEFLLGYHSQRQALRKTTGAPGAPETDEVLNQNQSREVVK